MQYGEHSAELPDVPFAVELARTEEDKQMLAFYVSSEQVGRAFLAPPGIPAERVAIMRKAYDDTMQDPELLAEIAKTNSEFNPLSGDKLQKLVAETTRVSPAIVARIRKILGAAR